MPYHEPDPSDPNVLVGSGTPCSEEELLEMAGAFSSELAQMGHDETHILGLFRKPFYAGPHLAWRSLGEDRVQRIVSEATEFWGHCRAAVRDAQPGSQPGRTKLLWPEDQPDAQSTHGRGRR